MNKMFLFKDRNISFFKNISYMFVISIYFTFHNTFMGGAFGRKGKNDYTVEAVELAKASGKPVKVIWSREDDTKHGFYHIASFKVISLHCIRCNMPGISRSSW